MFIFLTGRKSWERGEFFPPFFLKGSPLYWLFPAKMCVFVCTKNCWKRTLSTLDKHLSYGTWSFRVFFFLSMKRGVPLIFPDGVFPRLCGKWLVTISCCWWCVLGEDWDFMGFCYRFRNFDVLFNMSQGICKKDIVLIRLRLTIKLKKTSNKLKTKSSGLLSSYFISDLHFAPRNPYFLS